MTDTISTRAGMDTAMLRELRPARRKSSGLRSKIGRARDFIIKRVIFDTLLYPYGMYAYRRACETVPRSQAHTYTSFYRSPGQLDALMTRVVPWVQAGLASGDPLRINVLACSTGAEAYTIASELVARYPDLAFEIVASDLHESTVAQARSGVYSADEVFTNPDTPDEFVLRTFDRSGDRLVVKPHLRELVSFEQANLLDPHLSERFERADIVLAQNVFFHLDDADAETGFANALALTKPRSALLIDGMHLDMKERAIAQTAFKPLEYKIREIYMYARRHIPRRWWRKYYGAEPYAAFRPNKKVRYGTVFLRDAK